MSHRERPTPKHDHRHAFAGLNPLEREGLVVASRRNMLKAGLAGMAGLSLPGLLRSRAEASEAGRPIAGSKSVILLWMAGGPSQIDTWDPKPDRPLQNRGPFGVIPTRLPGVSSASTCRSRRRCSTSSRSSARWTPGTATTSRTRSSRRPTWRPSPAINPDGRDVPGDRLDRRQAPRGEPAGHAALRGVP